MRDLLDAELLALEVALHQPFVRLDHRVQELRAVLLHLRLQLGRNLARGFLLRTLGARVRAHVQEVDDAGQLVLAPDRQVHGDAVLRELRAQRLEDAEEICALAVEHVHEHDPRKPEVGRALPEPRRAHLDPHHAAGDEERALDDPQRGDRVALEPGVAGRVDEVDLAALPLGMAEGCLERHLALALVVVPVGHGRTGLDVAEPVDGAGLEQHRLDEGGLPRPAMTDDGDVADLARLDC